MHPVNLFSRFCFLLLCLIDMKNHLTPGILSSQASLPALCDLVISSYLSLFTNWVQGTSRRLLASITIVDYAGTIGVTFTISVFVPSLLTLLYPVLDTFVEPTEEVVSAPIINRRHF